MNVAFVAAVNAVAQHASRLLGTMSYMRRPTLHQEPGALEFGDYVLAFLDQLDRPDEILSLDADALAGRIARSFLQLFFQAPARAPTLGSAGSNWQFGLQSPFWLGVRRIRSSASTSS